MADNQVITKRVVVAEGGSQSLVTGGTYTCPAHTVDTSTDGGGAVNVAANGTLTGTDVTFADNVVVKGKAIATPGGAIFNSGTVSLTGATFTDNKAASGGAIYNTDTVTFEKSVTFTGNTAGKGGGAIYNTDTVTFEKSVTFTGNTSSEGGAIKNNGGTVTIKGDAEFSNNTAEDGGVIYLENEDVMLSIIGDAKFYNNVAMSGPGGVIFLNSGTNITFSITGNAEFLNNTASEQGGAIYYCGGTINFTGSSVSFSGNTAGRQGGAIFSTKTLTISGDANFTGNTATNKGGAICNSGTISLNSATFTGNTVTGTANRNGGGAIYLNLKQETTFTGNATFKDNSAATDGGAINMTSDSIWSKDPRMSTLTIGGDAEFTGNTAGSKGGAIYITSRKGYNPDMTIAGVATFTGNTVTGKDGKGGAVCIEGGTGYKATLTLKKDATFSGNTADFGGAIYNSDTVTLAGATFTGNTATSGGAIYNENNGDTGAIGVITFTQGAIFTDNKAIGNNNVGGAIENNGGTITFTQDAIFTDNTAIGNDNAGGAIDNFGGTITFAGATFTGNSAECGGAFNNAKDSAIDGVITFTQDAIFTGNSAECGGAIYNCKGTVVLTQGATFTGNTATENGGAIDNYRGTINFADAITLATATDTWINEGGSANRATVNWNLTGGTTTACINGFQWYSNNDAYTQQTITVKADQATGEYVIATGDFDMEKLTENKSTNFTVRSEGGVDTNITVNGRMQAHGNQGYKLSLAESAEAGADKLVLKVITYDDRIVVYGGTSIALDKATYTCAPYQGCGGALNVLSGGTVTGADVTFTDNTVTGQGNEGGAIYNKGKIEFNGKSGFSDNASASDGGAISNGGEMTFAADAIFERNRGLYGGAISNSGTMTFTSSAEFIDNQTSGNTNAGGAIENFGGTINFAGATFTGNSATSGGAIYNENNDSGAIGVITFAKDATFSGNTATGAGGAIYNGATVNISSAITLATATDTWVNAGVSAEKLATVNWDLSNVSNAVESPACINGFQYFSNEGDYTRQTITVTATQATGEYVIATGDLTTLTGKDTFYATIDGKTLSDAITVGATNPIIFNKNEYSLAVVPVNGNADAKLVLTIESNLPPRSDFNCSGKSDIAQLNGGLLFVTYDTASSFVKSGALWGVGDWQVVEFEGYYNDDKYADVLMTHYNADNNTTSVAALLNQQGTTISFAHDDIRGFDNNVWEYLGAADVNGDGITDVLTIQTAASAGDNDRSINAWILNSDGQYKNDVRVGGVNSEWSYIGEADVLGNGVENLLLQHESGQVSYWAAAGSDMTMIKSVQDRTMLGSGDFDGDGKGDILWKYNNDDTLWSWTHVDQGESLTDTRLGQVSELAGSWTFDRIGDYDGDGSDEILWGNADGQLAYSKANSTDFKNLTTIA